jgi:hypothetical protein
MSVKIAGATLTPPIATPSQYWGVSGYCLHEHPRLNLSLSRQAGRLHRQGLHISEGILQEHFEAPSGLPAKTSIHT